MKAVLVFLLVGLFSYLSNTQIIEAATATLNFTFREGILEYKQEVHSRIRVAIQYLKNEVERQPNNVKARYALAELVSI